MSATSHATPVDKTSVDKTPVDTADVPPMRVEHRGGDKFDITVRGHVVRVDQPVEDRGEDTAPTPTELFIASLASCVAVATHCTVHNTLASEPEVSITLADGPAD